MQSEIFWGLSMEGREGVNLSGVTVVASDATPDYHVAPRSETSAPTGGSASIHSVTPTMALATPTATALTIPTKKKRGRPRKYGPDGAVTKAFSPKPISSSAPSPVIDFSAGKRGKVKPASSVSKTRHEFENLGNGRFLCSSCLRLCTFPVLREMNG